MYKYRYSPCRCAQNHRNVFKKSQTNWTRQTEWYHWATFWIPFHVWFDIFRCQIFDFIWSDDELKIELTKHKNHNFIHSMEFFNKLEFKKIAKRMKVFYFQIQVFTQFPTVSLFRIGAFDRKHIRQRQTHWSEAENRFDKARTHTATVQMSYV